MRWEWNREKRSLTKGTSSVPEGNVSVKRAGERLLDRIIRWNKNSTRKCEECAVKQQTSEVSATAIICCFYCFIFIVSNINKVLQAFCCKLFNISHIIAFIKTSSYLWALDVMKPRRITQCLISSFPTTSALTDRHAASVVQPRSYSG